ncbi:MAG: hypothetical protein QOI11_2633 [Candidatus Eremiobacteraeota bacterium]|nr:hypothetical protein [Candidatus Eremiobacteraeota bacterium]
MASTAAIFLDRRAAKLASPDRVSSSMACIVAACGSAVKSGMKYFG